MTVNAHDAEEQLRPYLLDVLETGAAAEEATGKGLPWPRYVVVIEKEAEALAAALEKALELLGVQR